MTSKLTRVLLAFYALLALSLPFCLGLGIGDVQAKAGIVACRLVVPANPLTAQGLATPWKLKHCHESDPNQAVFVQGVIFDPATKQFSVYSPLVIDKGTQPAIAPTVPVLPAGAVVGLWGGGNDDQTTLVGAGASSCVNGVPGSPFGQVFFCGATAFLQAVHAAGFTAPPLGMGSDGLPCPTVRDFRIVDQDQSDNVQTTYLVTPNGQTAQNTAANRAALGGNVVVQKNPSDNRVLTNFVDPALGCQPWMVPDLADNGALVPAQILDELQAGVYQAAPQATIPSRDPMVLVDGNPDLTKLNNYRAGVDQPTVMNLDVASTNTYCMNIKATAPNWLKQHKALFLQQPSPVPALGANLYAFLKARLKATFMLLNCD